MDALETIKNLSKDGKAYVALSIPFGGYEIKSYSSPSRIPDSVIDLAIGQQIAYKGKLQPFSKAALIRESNRALGNE